MEERRYWKIRRRRKERGSDAMPREKGIVLELIEVDEKVCDGQSFCVFIDPAIFCSRENSLKTELCFRGMSSWCQAMES